MLMSISTTLPALTFVIHLLKDSLCTRKLLYNTSVISYMGSFVWIILSYALSMDSFFGKRSDNVKGEVRLLETILELFETTVIALFMLHAVSCMRTYVKILEDGTDVAGHQCRSGAID